MKCFFVAGPKKTVARLVMLCVVLFVSILPEDVRGSTHRYTFIEAKNIRSLASLKSRELLKRTCDLIITRPLSFVRQHPVVIIGAVGLISLGLIGYYYGFFSRNSANIQIQKEFKKKEKIPVIPEIKKLKEDPVPVIKHEELSEKNSIIKKISLEITNPKKSVACTEISLSTDNVECLLKSKQNRSWEDVGTLSQWKLNDKEAVIIAVFDGNGHPDKPKIARLLAKKLQGKIANELLKLSDEDIRNQKLVSVKLTQIFRDFDKMLSCEKGGSTACIGVYLPQHNVFVVANTGDSQLGLIQEINNKSELFVTACHNPEAECETRIPKNAINFTQYKGYGCFRNESRELRISRAFGYVNDENGTKGFQYLIVDPEVTIFDLAKTKIQGVVVGCDGLWDPFEENIKAYVQSIIEKINQSSLYDLGEIADDAIEKAGETPIKFVPFDGKKQAEYSLNDDDITIGLMQFK